nr:hypothetical protein [uncultured Sellimonas sp.]
MIINEYKEFACVKNLGNNKDIFIKMVEHYGKDLYGKIIMDGSVYTIHDFNTHCVDIYKIISEVLLDPKRAYGSDGLTEKELYILDMAVLFHDISMSQELATERGNHSEKAAEFVQKLYDTKDSMLHKEGNLSANEIKALKAIIKAHSDVKDGTVPDKERGLNDPKLTDNMPARSGKIRARLLAGILRLADELDITSERLGTMNIEENLKEIREEYNEIEMKIKSGEGEQLQEKLKKYKGYIESLSHWENLHLFSQVVRENQDDTVYLITDEDYLRQQLEDGNSATALSRRILSVYNKIEKEWEEIKKIVIEESKQRLDIKNFFPVMSIKIKCSVDLVDRELNKQLMNVSKVKEVRNEENGGAGSEEKGEEKIERSEIERGVQIIDPLLAERLTNEIKRRHLLKAGHFLLDEIFCARDWIDTKEIVETKALLDKIAGCLIEHIKQTCELEKKYIIIGLDLEGALLASRLSMGLKLPFSYIIPVRERSNFSPKEVEVSIDGYEHIILVADVIVAFDTIKKALDEIAYTNKIPIERLGKSISQIYSIFYRESKLVDLKEIGDLQAKTFCVNTDFPVELFRKEDCHYMKAGECLALNNRLKLV